LDGLDGSVDQSLMALKKGHEEVAFFMKQKKSLRALF
jgi:hypothetical protein